MPSSTLAWPRDFHLQIQNLHINWLQQTMLETAAPFNSGYKYSETMALIPQFNF
jgi:hypothetical protein